MSITDIRDYAERVWTGEIDNDIATGRGGHPVIDIAEGVGFLPGFGNAIAFRDENELALFDTGNSRGAQRGHGLLRAWADKPLTTAFYSHGHTDHVCGLAPFEAEPGARIEVIGQERVRDRFDRYRLTAGYNEIINRRQFQIPDLTWPSDLRSPDLTFRDSMTVRRAGVTFELFHAEGETDDAAVAYVPEHKLLMPGDMFVWLVPNCGNPQKAQRFPRERAQALRRMAGLGAEIMLPSHGAPIFGADRIEQACLETADWLDSIVGQTLDMMNAGRRLDDIVPAVTPPAHLADRVYLRARYDEPEFIVRNLWRRYGGWYDGNPARLKPSTDAELARAVVRLAGGLRPVLDEAARAADAGDLRLASHFAEMAVQAEPESGAAHETRARVYGERARTEESLMARGVFAWAATEAAEAAALGEPEWRPAVASLGAAQ